jgi:hypothetical protein
MRVGAAGRKDGARQWREDVGERDDPAAAAHVTGLQPEAASLYPMG